MLVLCRWPPFPGGVETVKANFQKFHLLDSRVHFVVGYFNDTLPKLKEPAHLAILRLDGDMYSSTMDILENLYDRVVPGGYCIIGMSVWDPPLWLPHCHRVLYCAGVGPPSSHGRNTPNHV